MQNPDMEVRYKSGTTEIVYQHKRQEKKRRRSWRMKWATIVEAIVALVRIAKAIVL